jgi:hypothetical protein
MEKGEVVPKKHPLIGVFLVIIITFYVIHVEHDSIEVIYNMSNTKDLE